MLVLNEIKNFIQFVTLVWNRIIVKEVYKLFKFFLCLILLPPLWLNALSGIKSEYHIKLITVIYMENTKLAGLGYTNLI